MTKVFISYSHKDERWLERLMVHLRPLERIGQVDLWADTRISPGAEWVKEIESALASANVAVLLISGHFLDSRFITSKELPSLLRAAKRQACHILPLVVEPCLFSEIHELQQFQAVNRPERPLAKINRAEAEELLVQVAREILNSARLSDKNAHLETSEHTFVDTSHLYDMAAGMGLGESGPSASEFVSQQVRRMISDLEQLKLPSDTRVKELIDENLKGRDQLLRPLASFFYAICKDAQKNPRASSQTEVLLAAERFLKDCNRAQAEIAKRILKILQNNVTGLVEVIVLADFSISIAKALSQLATHNSQKIKAAEVCLILSGRHFSVQGDTERWEAEFRNEHMRRFYKFERRVPFEELDRTFEEIGHRGRRAMLLMGVERAYPQGQFLDWPGMGRIFNAARMHSMEVVVAAECYKVQPLLRGEISRTGLSPYGSPIELTPVDMGPGVYFVSDHAVHTAESLTRDERVSLKCCYRFWRNQMEDKDYPLAIIFDLDGTILKSEGLHKALYQDVARSVGYELSDAEYFSKLQGMTDEETFELILHLAGKKGAVTKLAAEKQRKFFRHLSRNQIEPVPGVIDYIQALHQQGHQLAVATSATRDEANIALRNFKLTNEFQVLVSSEDVTIGKPSPEVYRKAMEVLHLAPSECLVYEDSVAGIRAAVAAQICVVAVGGIDDDMLRLSGAHMVIPNFTNHKLPQLSP